MEAIWQNFRFSSLQQNTLRLNFRVTTGNVNSVTQVLLFSQKTCSQVHGADSCLVCLEYKLEYELLSVVRYVNATGFVTKPTRGAWHGHIISVSGWAVERQPPLAFVLEDLCCWCFSLSLFPPTPFLTYPSAR